MPYRLLNPYTLFFLLTAVFSVGIAAVAYANRAKRAALPLAGFMIAVSVWCAGDAMRIAALSRSHVLFWNKISYVGIVSTLPAWVTFALTLTNRERWLKRQYILGLVAVSLTALVVVFTNHVHGLWRAGETITTGTAPPVLAESRGLLWYPWALWSYTLVLASLYFILREFLQPRHSRIYRSQIGLVLAGSLVAIGSTAVYLLGIVSFDITPFGVFVMGLAYATALYRYQLLDITPIARDIVLDNIDSGVLVLDQNDRVVDANDQAREVLQRTELEGVHVRSLLPERISYERLLEDVDRVDEPVTVDIEGDRRHFDLEISQISDSLGSALGRALIFTDVTELVEKRRRLKRRSERLEQQNERLDQFASVVSHDLRNPLQIVSASLELAQTNEDFDEIDRARRSVDRMGEIIEDLLALARASEDVDSTDSVDLEELAIAARQQVPTDQGEVHIEQSLPTVKADATRLQQVLENLIRNAFEHNEPPVTVTIGPLDGNPVSGMYVEDDGSGVPADQREAIFEHGYSTNDDGTGFGLSIVRDVIEAHGWTIRIVDAADRGARFEIEM
mgnify:CR=1 FL=1